MLKIFLKFKPIHWVLTAVLIGITVGQVWFDVQMLPDYTEELIRRMMEGYSSNYLWRTGGWMLLYAGGSLLANLVGGIIAAYLAASLGKRIRKDLFAKVQSFGFEEMNKFSTASLITRSTNDITQVQTVAVMMLRMAINAPITAIWAIVRIQSTSWQFTVTTAVAIGGVAVLLLIACIFVLPKFRLIQKLTDRLNAVARQNLTGLRVVKAYNADEYEQNKLHDVNYKLNQTNIFANSVMAVMLPILNLVMQGVNLVIWWLGAHLIQDGTIAFPQLQFFSSLIMQVLLAFLMIAMLLVMVPRAQVSAKRIHEVLRTNAKITDKAEPLVFAEDCCGTIEFDNVTFKYPDAENSVLENISFEVKKGQTAAFIGSTGSGKSTLINLIPRFYDVSEGGVKVGGLDVRDVAQKDLRKRIGYVPQKGVLFSGTIEENIGYCESAEKEKAENPDALKQAAHVACAEEFIEDLDEKYEAKVSQGGKNFSGGQKQRMSIARAVAAKPEIFIFDDSFSALDYKTDKEVRARLKQFTGESTCLIVAQRIGTIMDADVIVVLEKGKMVGKGTHKELLESCEIYKEIALSQLSEEELVS